MNTTENCLYSLNNDSITGFQFISSHCVEITNANLSSEKVTHVESVPLNLTEEKDDHNNAIANLKQALALIQRIDKKHEMIFEPKYQEEEMTQKHLKLTNALKNLQLHFNFILEILTTDSEEEIPEVLIKYKPIIRNYKPINKKEEICLLLINEAFKNVIFCVIKEVEKATDIFFVLRSDGTLVINTDPEALDYIQIVTSKIETMIEYFPEAATLDSNDIFAQRRDSEIWKKLETGTEFIVLAEKEILRNRWKKMYMMLTILNAMVHKHQQIDSKNIKDKLKGAFSALYFGAKMKEAEVKASLYLSNPQMNSAFQVWNFAENGIVKELMKFTLPTIDYDRKLYVHRLFPSINRETILKEYEEGTLTKIIKNTFQPVNLTPKKDLILNSIFTKQADAVAIRLISPFPLVIQGNNSEMARAMAMKAVNRFNQFIKQVKNSSDINPNPEGIIIHIHGGGFVSGSSSTHRNYLYRWAKKLNRVIFSIDYRLAPDYPYPAALDDVWQAYNWIINYAEPLLGIKTDSVVLAGDSAGGNLVMALTLRAIKMGIKVPNGCFLVYPALNMCPKKVRSKLLFGYTRHYIAL